MFKKILALFVSLAIMSSMSLTAFGEGYFDATGRVEDSLEDEVAATVYVSSAGSDSGKGTADSPYLTLNRAIEMVYQNGTVIVEGTLTLPSGYSWIGHGKTVTIKGGTINAAALSRVVINDSVTFNDITLTFANNARFFANGYKLTMGENVTFTNTANPIWVYGGGQENTTVKSTNVTLLGGVYTRAYGGSYGGTVIGDTNLTVGGSVNPDLDTTSHSSICNFYGGGQNDAIGGDANFTFGGNAKASYIFGASENASALTTSIGTSATIGGKANFNVTGGKAYSIYGGSNNVNHKSDVNLVVTGGEFSQIFGGNQAAALNGNVKMDIAGATVKRRIYGGCYNETSGFSGFATSYSVTGSIDLTIRGTANITFSDSDNDRSIYAHSRHKTNSSNEISTLVFGDATAYSKYQNKLTYQDSVMSMFMGNLSAADYIHYYTYTANDTTDVITQKCSYHSSLSATATLGADETVSKVYNGQEIKAAKVTYSGWEGEPVGDIVYSNNVNAGTAAATISHGGVSVTYNYTIEKAEQSAPETSLFSTVAETIKSKADGTISGLTTDMEISSDGGVFAAVSNPEALFAAGTYYIRYPEKANYKASPATPVTVDEGRYLVVSFKADGEAVATRNVEWNGTLTDIPEVPNKEGYDQIAPYWDVSDFSGIQSDIEVNAVYTLNGLVVNFADQNGNIFYTAYVQSGGNVSQQDLINAEEAAPSVYGYDFIGWDNGTENVVENITITALYSRQTTTYNTIVNMVGGNVETQELQFDQRFTVKDAAANSFKVDGQIVGGKGSITLYGCGQLTIDSSTEVAPEEVSVAILKTVTDTVKGKNAYRVFAHVYNPTEEEISGFGIMFAPGSAYTEDEAFTMEALKSNSYITSEANEPTHDLLVSFVGITTEKQVTRVVRAYAAVSGGNAYSNVYKHTFN